MTGRTAIITAVALTILGGLYFFNASPVNGLNMATESNTPQHVPGLEFRLSQISRNPPSILATLKNSHPSSPFTLLKWGTPLDDAATNTGVFKLVDAQTGEEVQQDVIMLKRLWPPRLEDYVTVAPGTEQATEVVFNKPWIPKTAAKYRVVAEGRFMGVWEKSGPDARTEDIEAFLGPSLSDRTFVSNEAELVVE